MRLKTLGSFIFFFLGLIVLALVYMQLIRGEYYHEQSTDNRIRVVPTEAPRGRILDRNGEVLADNRPAFNVAVIPQDIEDKEALFKYLGGALNKDPNALLKTFNRRRVTPFDSVVIAQDIDRNTLIAIEENRFQFPGLEIERSFERFYPFGEAGAHAVGYVGKISAAEAEVLQGYGYTPLSIVGKSGVEKYYNSIIEGVMGGRQIEVNSRGQEERLIGIKAPAQGQDITLTLDQRLQTAAAQLLAGRRGSIVVMDTNTGEVLSLVSSPAFDPNVFTDRSLGEKIGGYIDNEQYPLLNRAIAGLYPPGSVFKVPVALAALEREKVTLHTTFDCPGYYMLGEARFGCAHVHSQEDLVQAIAHSCNVYFYRAGQMVTASIIGAYASAFGLDKITGIDLPFEAAGKMILPGQKRGGWYTGNTLNLSIGQGDTLTTPLQLTVMMGAVANDGILLRPQVLKAVNARPMKHQDLSKRPIVRLKDSTWRAVQQGLRQVVEHPEGTGYLLHDVPDVKIWAKTGTAQAGRQGDHAWFAGYARSPKSNVAFCVFLEHGGSSSNAVALTRDLMLQMQSFGLI